MLAFINEKGPLRKGVFRTPTHMKSGRELKEKLNSGKKVNWNSESIFVIVAVLKVGRLLAVFTHSLTLKLYDWYGLSRWPRSYQRHNMLRMCKTIKHKVKISQSYFDHQKPA